ncbi:MAG: MaoC family dehydratase [Acidothermus sp.]|nr:MaoC family dehydratase [Acidothermus sp.]MCL6537804.1 MaoC family dehydratase [Acidothermus sp.]
MTDQAHRPRYDALTVGDRVVARQFTIRRADLIRYAGVSGDENPIHWSDRIARAVGLPGVIAHGMLTMALAGRAVTEWADDPGAVEEFAVRFTQPVVVPDDDGGVTLDVEATVAEKLPAPRVRLDLTVRCEGEKVLGAARAVVRLGPPTTFDAVVSDH